MPPENYKSVSCHLVSFAAAHKYPPFLTLLRGFPAGADGSMDFGILKVLDDVTQVLTLQNKGKYDIVYRWVW